MTKTLILNQINSSFGSPWKKSFTPTNRLNYFVLFGYLDYLQVFSFPTQKWFENAC